MQTRLHFKHNDRFYYHHLKKPLMDVLLKNYFGPCSITHLSSNALRVTVPQQTSVDLYHLQEYLRGSCSKCHVSQPASNQFEIAYVYEEDTHTLMTFLQQFTEYLTPLLNEVLAQSKLKVSSSFVSTLCIKWTIEGLHKNRQTQKDVAKLLRKELAQIEETHYNIENDMLIITIKGK